MLQKLVAKISYQVLIVVLLATEKIRLSSADSRNSRIVGTNYHVLIVNNWGGILQFYYKKFLISYFGNKIVRG